MKLDPNIALTRFLEFAGAYPDHPAVETEGRRVGYGELADLVCRLARAFAAVKPQPRVLIHLPQGHQAYAAMLAAMMAGGYYAPNDLAAPRCRQLEVLHGFEPDLVVTSTRAFAGLSGEAGDLPIVDVDALPKAGLEVPLLAQELAYVMFTSGSTGRPKGVMIPREALAHFADWAWHALSVTPADRWSQHPNIAFDLSVLDIYGALGAGATLCPFSTAGDRRSPGAAIQRLGLTLWNSVPSVIDLMRKAGQLTPAHLASLRLMTFCGESLERDQLEAIFEVRPDLTVHNTYGPTEATVSCTLIRLTAQNYLDAVARHVALGEPIESMRLELRDGATSDEGEIVLSGPQVALGYWRDPDATSAAFGQSGYGAGARRTYRTGDIGRRIEGQLYFLQRCDQQVKIEGHRVELGAIDAALRAEGAAAACTVLIDGELHAFVQATEALTDLSALRAALARSLADHEVPKVFHLVESLPLSANDKIDSGALVAAYREGIIMGDALGHGSD